MIQSLIGQLCACFELINDSTPEQLSLLHQGGKFARSLYLGFSSQELQIELSQDNSTIRWKTINTSSTEFGEIDFSGNIKSVKSTGQQVSNFLFSYLFSLFFFTLTFLSSLFFSFFFFLLW